MIFLCLVDLGVHNRYINPTIPESFFKNPAILREINVPAAIYRDESLPFLFGVEKIEKKKIIAYYLNSFFPFSGITYGTKYLFNRDFMSSYPSSQMELRKIFQSLSKEDKLKILNYLGCQYYIGIKPLFKPDSAKRLSIGKFRVYIEEISKEPVRPFLVFNYVQAHSLKRQFEIFLEPEFDPRKIALLDSNLIFNNEIDTQRNFQNFYSGLKRKNINSIEVIQEKNGYGKYNVSLEKPGLVIFPGNWAKGWRAYVDGQRIKVFPANLFSKGIFLPSGHYEVHLRYLPKSFIIGSVLSIFSLIFLLIFWGFGYKLLLFTGKE